MTEPKRLIDMDEDDVRAMIRKEITSAVSEAMIEQKLLSADELAKRLGVKARSIATFVSRDELPAMRLGPRKLAFKWSDVEAWARKRGRNLNPTIPANDRRRHLRPVKE